MINTIFHFVNDPTFDYQTAVNNGDISEYTIVFNSADHSIHCKGTMFGRMSRADMAETLGNISDLIPVATDSTLGGIKIGYTNDSDQDSRRYGVVLDSNNKAYVEVPWSDTITPDFDDTDLKNLIATERSRIDNFISTLSSTIDAKNRELLADAQWVQEVFGVPQAEGSIWLQFENEIDHYLNEYMVWDWVDPNDHTKGRTAKISSIEQDVDGITTRVGATEERLDNADGEGVTIETFVSTIKQTANDIDAHVGRVETKADANTGAIQSTNVAVSNLELSVNGFYKVTIVSAPNPDTSVNISTISAQLSDRTTALADNEELNGKLFTTAPTLDVIYKKGSQYFKLNKVNGAVESLAGLTASVSEYKGNMDDLVTVVASTLQLKANETDSGYISTSDLASVIANGRYNAYAGLNATVLATYNNLSGLSDDVSELAGDLSDLEGDFATLSSNVVLSSNLNTEVANCTSFVNLSNTVNNITGLSQSLASLLATIDSNDWAGFMATVTKDSNTTPATYTTEAKIHADNIILDGNTFANSIFADFVDTTTLTAGTATIQALLKIGGSGTPGTIEMYNTVNNTDTKIGVWDADKFAIVPGGIGSSSITDADCAFLVNKNGSGSAAKGNITWNANGDVTVKGTLDGCDGTFSGSLSAVSLSGMTISGNLIEGGSIVVGGSGNATDGSIVVKDVNDTEVGRLDKTGVSASLGTIGGFSISSDELSNNNYNASISISNSNNTLISRIGKDATDAMTNQSCSLEAQSKGTGTYNTALYLNADGATYNYAFHGNGNGVLNGLIFGFKTKVYTISGSSDTTTQMEITDGATFVILGNKTSGHACFNVPTLNNVKQALGLGTSSSTPFSIEVNFINHSSYDYVYLLFYDTGRTTLPKWWNYDFDGTTQDMQLAKGDFARFLLTYDGSNYRANRIVHHDGGWG